MPPPKTVQGRFTLRRTLAGIATAASKLDCVQIDGLVVLKIIKHSRDEGNPSEMVSGQLLGMDITQNDTTTLEVGASGARGARLRPGRGGGRGRGGGGVALAHEAAGRPTLGRRVQAAQGWGVLRPGVR